MYCQVYSPRFHIRSEKECELIRRNLGHALREVKQRETCSSQKSREELQPYIAGRARVGSTGSDELVETAMGDHYCRHAVFIEPKTIDPI